MALILACMLAESHGALDEIVVTATKTEQRLGDTTASVSIIDDETLALIRHSHISETLHRAPGVWISRGNGQEHLTAIRSPVLTGAGSCGAFVMAQDGVSLRAPGFCNVNELFEATTETAGRIEVIRGPGSSIYGPNALHGVINVLTPSIDPGAGSFTLEAGPDDYYRTTISASSAAIRADFSGTTDGGYKDESGFDQQKLVLKHAWQSAAASVTTTFSYTNLNQETAGFVEGFEVYRDSGAKRDNPNPEAYRDARSYRLVNTIEHAAGQGQLTWRPYLRSVDMRFLQHFLPGQAIEENGHDSIGLMMLWEPASWWRVGAELDYTHGYLKETQPGQTQGSAFLTGTIPQGKHYDYDVDAAMAGIFIDAEVPLGERLTVAGSARLQYTAYDYTNNMLDGRTRDDGTECGFGGCRFSRPADRRDSFTNFSPKVAFIYVLGAEHQLHGSISTGFRAPQATELYRLQASQNVANIDPVELDSLELGVRGTAARLDYAVAAFIMEKDNFIFRDTERRNVDNGETSHRGVEFDFSWRFNESVSVDLAFTFAEHRYENSPQLVSTPISGNIIDTAPKTLGALGLNWQVSGQHLMALEWVHIGDYYLDPENQHEYAGHDLLHLRGLWKSSEGISLSWRIMNLTNEDYADRADLAFGQYRYFVGTPRSLFVGITFDF